MTDSEYPWRDESRLYELYWEQELSTVAIADKLGCTQQTVWKWMQRFDIPRRDAREAAPNQRRHPAVFTDRGYVICASNYRGTTDSVGTHRLVMVAERGFDDVADKHSTFANQITV
jgi:predicted acyl esterase